MKKTRYKNMQPIYKLTKKEAKEKLEYIRQEIRMERVSYDEIFELQSLIPYIDKNDIELLEAAGVPEK